MEKIQDTGNFQAIVYLLAPFIIGDNTTLFQQIKML